MESNLYEPPKSDVTVADKKPGSTFKAVGLGALVEIAGSSLVGMLLGVVYVIVLSQQGVPAEALQSALEQMDPWSGLGLIGMALGFTVSALAGFVCAKIANRVSYKSPYILSGISFALTLVTGYWSYPLTEVILLGMVSVCAVLAGAWLQVRKLKLA